MRDPAAALCFEPDHVVRNLRTPLGDDHFLKSALARRWVDRGDLVDFRIVDDRTVEAPRLPFVSYPTEWCDSQLHAAGQLTLKLQSEAVEAGFDLKDASAWNVIFDGGRPLFCDLMSFEPLRRKQWWAAGQFARHFILPLLLAKRRGLHSHQCFAMWRDGVPGDVARRLLGPARFLSRYWPLVTAGTGEAGLAIAEPSEHSAMQNFREGLQTSLAWMLNGVRPMPRRVPTHWQNYVEEREHYSAKDLTCKQEVLAHWLDECQPGWVLDLGCNSGEFSRLAQARGAQVVAADLDHGAIERLRSESLNGVYPVLANLDDVSGGRGWSGSEFPGLIKRWEQRFDLTMMLALIHHLALGCAIPLDAIARLATKVSRRWLVVELLTIEDPQVQKLLIQRQRPPGDFEIAKQKQAFEAAGFQSMREIPLPSGRRTLCLMDRLS